ncbi:MAG: polysaccharide deacetylase family protein [Firmicutes bacterium]|nr:polysaccharide deacetylase family protein [Bacillota bacterium]
MSRGVVLVALVCAFAVVSGVAGAGPAVIRRGDAGPTVKRIQESLALLGIPTGPVDGVYGPLTEKAVRSFQGRKKLPVDGVVGPRTSAALEEERRAAERKAAEERKLREKRAFLENLKKKTLEARKSQPAQAVVGAPAEDRGAVYLTFDDGPDPQTTPYILDTLAAHGVHATFFVVGERAERNPDLVRRMAREGHSVQNHSYSHWTPGSANAPAVEEEIDRTARMVFELTGVNTRYFRPPYGDTSDGVIAAARNRGHTVVLWSNIWGSATSSVLAAASDGAIIMVREQSSEARALPALIAGLREAGYRFLTIGP